MFKVIANTNRGVRRATIGAATERDAAVKFRIMLARAGFAVRRVATVPVECV